MATRAERNILAAEPFPIHYQLRIAPNFTDFTFSGVVKIQVDCGSIDPSTINKLTMNAVDIKVQQGSVFDETGKEALFKFSGDSAVEYDERNGRITINFGEGNAVNKSNKIFQIEIEYTGEINNKMAGFYRSTYKNDAGETKVMGVTQFEAVDARRGLPCWDEPSHKATFQVTIVAPKGLTALSNTVVTNEKTLDNGDVEVSFEKTPKMSSYLLAWVIGEFEMIQTLVPKVHPDGKGKEPTLLRVITRPGKKEQGRFALEVGQKVLPLIEEFFNFEWFLKKNDMVAICDFAAGAMENWGLVTYRETALLCDEKSAAKTKEWVALVVAHENIHFFFGNTVTMEWWEALWLNESFTTFVEYVLVDKLFPDWQVFTQFVYDEMGRALDLDSRESSHPIEVPIKNAEEIDEIFDVISYQKGCSIIRQVTEYIGMDAFKKGIQNYIKAFAFKNATTNDLLKYLSEASGKDLVSVMSNWIFKQGFPLLTVKRDPADKNKINITQRRFLSQPSAQETAAKDETLWQIPLKVLTEKKNKLDQVEFDLMTERSMTVDDVSSCSWIKVNGNQSSFVRVHYADEDLLEGLKKPIADQTLNAVDRFSILADLHALAQTGIASTISALDFSKCYVNETDATVWCAVTSFEAEVRRLLLAESQEVRDSFDKFARDNLYSKIVDKVGFVPDAQKDEHRTASLRANVFSRASAVKEPKAVAAALSQWDAYISEGKEIPADLRRAVYSTALRERGRPAFEKLKELHGKAADDAAEAIRIVQLLGTVKDEALCKEAAEYCLSDAVRAQDAFVTLVALSGNPDGQKVFENLIINDFDRLWAKFPGMILSRVVKAVENMLVEPAVGEKILEYINTLPEQQKGQIMRSAQQGLEGLKVSYAWKKRAVSGLIEYLKKQ